MILRMLDRVLPSWTPRLIQVVIFVAIAWVFTGVESKATLIAWCWGNATLIALFVAQCYAVAYIADRKLMVIAPIMLVAAVGCSYWAAEGLPTVLLIEVGQGGYWYASVLTPVATLIAVALRPLLRELLSG